MSRFHGVIPPVVTLFRPDDQFDPEQQARLIDKIIAGGVHGLFFLGSTGEAAHMTTQMRREVAEFAIAHTAGRVPVMVGISVPGTAESIGLAEHAAAHGADAIVAINPYYSSLSQDGIYRYFRAIADAVPLPMMVYNFPGATGQDISPELVRRLALDCESIVGFKDTVDTISHIRRVISAVKPERPDFVVLAGFEEYMLLTLILGGDGSVPASGNFAPRIAVSLYEAFRAGDYETAFAVQRQLADIMPLYWLESPYFATVKTAMKLAGLAEATTVMPPSQDPSPETVAIVATTLRKLGVLDK
ncbi:MAG: dihydrodipicolinate synthase family protein [Alphaproteobacteria bacterium]|nr:dihydrodipicolinate synthase family protein [Alphaproteobacteria bacterium]